MIDIKFQIISLVISLSILILILKQKKIGLFSERSILICVILSIAMSIFGVLSRLFIYYNELLPTIITTLLCKLSFVLMAFTVISTISYFLIGSYNENKNAAVSYLSLALMIVSAACIFVFDLKYDVLEDGSIIYDGLSYYATYGICIILGIVFTLFLVLRKDLTSLKKTSIIVWASIIILGFVVNILFPYLSCSSMFVALSLVSVVTLSENIENYFNIGLECFQYDALMSFLRIKYLSKKPLSILYTYIFNENNEYRKESAINGALDGAIELFKKNNKIKVFKTQNNEMVICSKDPNTVNNYAEKLKEFYDNYQAELNYANRTDSAIVCVEDIHLANSTIDLMNLLASSRLQGSKDALNTSVIHIDNSIIEAMHNELEMLKDIDYSLENDGVLLNYQPVYSVGEGRITSVEVLTRIKSREGAIILPGKFIPVAEKYGRIVKLGETILKKSCDFFNEMNRKGVGLEDISINFSSYQLEDTAIINSIIDAVSDNKLNPSALCIEITNATSLRRRKDFLKNIDKMASFGIAIALTGYGNEKSNLDYITNMPADLIRFDRNFIWKSFENAKSDTILKNAIELIHSFKMKSIAVGIETEEQCKKMIERNIDFLQGIFIGKPMSQQEFVTYIESKGNMTL